LAVGWQAMGECAIAWNLANGGQMAIGHYYALADDAHAIVSNSEFVKNLVMANPFFRFCWFYLRFNFLWVMWVWAIPMVICMFFLQLFGSNRGLEKQAG
jgi:hypothetical protein